MKRDLSEQKFAWIIILPAVIIVFGIVLFPIIQTFIYSIKNLDIVSGSTGEFVWLKNYHYVLTDPNFWDTFARTIYFTVASIVLELTIGILIALLLNENFFGVRFLRTIIILPWAIPFIVNGQMWNWIFNPNYGILNSVLKQFKIIPHYIEWLSDPWLALHVILFMDAWKMTPLVVIFLLASLQLTNKSTYEAATVDGANAFRRFFSLTLPYLKPTILVVIVIRTMDIFKIFDLIYITTKGGPADGTMILSYKAFNVVFEHLNYSTGSSYAFIIAIIIIFITISYVKILQRGDA
jgi:multiple sugar transport system permease protein/N,N'-diacetylchitobiose transport system permease protein